MQMIMKKYLRFVLAALSLFAAVSCAKEVAFNEEEQEKEIVVPDVKTVPYDFTVGVEQTKSYINEKQIFWEKGDSLAVIDNVNGTVHKFTLKSFEGKEARFSGEINKAATTLYVIYPYDENASVNGGGQYYHNPSRGADPGIQKYSQRCSRCCGYSSCRRPGGAEKCIRPDSGHGKA